MRFLLLFSILLSGCFKENEALLRFDIPTQTNDRINDIARTGEQAFVLVGGNAWTNGLFMQFENGQLTRKNDLEFELLDVAYDSDRSRIMASGLNGLFIEKDSLLINSIIPESSVIRGILPLGEEIALVGGKSWEDGFFHLINSSKQVITSTQFPREIREIAQLGPALLIAGFGGVYSSNDTGLNWIKTELIGDFYVDIAVEDKICIILGQNGQYWLSRDEGASWNSHHIPGRKVRHNKCLILDDRFYFLCEGGLIKTRTSDGHWDVFKIGEEELLGGLISNGELYVVGSNGLFARLTL